MRLSPYFEGFRDELEKIALAGALVGGALGYAASPGTVTGKAIGTAVGAGLGHGAQAALRKGKKIFYTEPRERDRASMNYVPSTVAAEQASPYGPYAI